MAKLSIVARDRKKEALVKRYATKRAALKEAGDWEGLDKLPRSSSRVRIRNRCKLTGRPRGYMRKFGICRNQFRQMASDGLIPGITKASW
ncbi:MAG: 30S ribosomal protein S14 [Cyclobacteriaceae bacterium]|nr:30S ribosomal protein S14 [Cyclobacteriaceae bacterium]